MLMPFIRVTYRALRDWSTSRSCPEKPFMTAPIPSNDDWLEAKRLFYDNSAFPKTQIMECHRIPYWTVKADQVAISQAETKKLANLFIGNFSEFTLFDDYKKARQCVAIVWLKSDRQARCSCSDFLKRSVCSHSLALDVHHGLRTFPIHVISLPIGQRPKKGRRRKALDWQRDNPPCPPAAETPATPTVESSATSSAPRRSPPDSTEDSVSDDEG
jgi:hypothetical protein